MCAFLTRSYVRFVADGIYSSIGTYNFDRWSSNRNMEVNATFLDPDIARELEEQFQLDLRHAKEITLADLDKRPRWQQLLHATCYYLARLPRKGTWLA